MNDRLLISSLRLLPKNALSRLVGRLTDAGLPGGPLRAAMRSFAWAYRIDLTECPPLESYPTFGKFFARPLLPGRRPIAPGDDVVVSPVDAVVSETGVATAGRLIQAKGIDYGVGALLGDEALGQAAAEAAKPCQLLGALHPFGHGRHAQGGGPVGNPEA